MRSDSPVKILLVDDDKVVLNTLSHGLSAYQYLVTTCENGRDALQKFQTEAPDLLILDYHLPDMSGADVARRVLKITYKPIIMLSAHHDPNIVRTVVDIGISSYLVKPIDAAHMAPSIEAVLARASELAALLKQGESVQQAMEKNRIINAAVGIIMQRVGLSQDQSYAQLRAYARSERKQVHELASQLVDAVSTANDMICRITDRKLK